MLIIITLGRVLIYVCSTTTSIPITFSFLKSLSQCEWVNPCEVRVYTWLSRQVRKGADLKSQMTIWRAKWHQDQMESKNLELVCWFLAFDLSYCQVFFTFVIWCEIFNLLQNLSANFGTMPVVCLIRQTDLCCEVRMLLFVSWSIVRECLLYLKIDLYLKKTHFWMQLYSFGAEGQCQANPCCWSSFKQGLRGITFFPLAHTSEASSDFHERNDNIKWHCSNCLIDEAHCIWLYIFRDILSYIKWLFLLTSSKLELFVYCCLSGAALQCTCVLI